MTEFHPDRGHARKWALIEAGMAAALLLGGILVDPVMFAFAAALALGAWIMFRKSRGTAPLMVIDATGISAPAGAARWDQITGYGVARFGGKRRGKDCFWVETAPGGPEFKSLHGDQVLAGRHQLRIPFNDFDRAGADPLATARAHRPELEQKP